MRAMRAAAKGQTDRGMWSGRGASGPTHDDRPLRSGEEHVGPVRGLLRGVEVPLRDSTFCTRAATHVVAAFFSRQLRRSMPMELLSFRLEQSINKDAGECASCDCTQDPKQVIHVSLPISLGEKTHVVSQLVGKSFSYRYPCVGRL